jgi:twitching motility protein PilU
MTQPVSQVDIEVLLRYAVKRKASDLFVTAGLPPSVKINGKMEFVVKAPLTAEQARRLVYSAMPPRNREEFEATQESNFALNFHEIGRFRVNVFQSQNNVGMVVRRIQTTIPSLDDLGLPQTLKQLATARRGLVFFVGATGVGKSTSLAAMVGYRNRHSTGHIVTIEEPIEFVHTHHSCIVTQREVGIDTQSYDAALRNALRQAPDVIMIGEVRSREAMEHALAFAETGHLCLATLHSTNAQHAIERILNFFPDDRHPQLRMDLSTNLKAIAAQRLVPAIDGTGRRVAMELLVNTPRVADLIRTGDFHLIREVMSKSAQQGMKTFDQSVYELYAAGQISQEEAITHADSENEVRLMIKLNANPDPKTPVPAAPSRRVSDVRDDKK